MQWPYCTTAIARLPDVSDPPALPSAAPFHFRNETRSSNPMPLSTARFAAPLSCLAAALAAALVTAPLAAVAQPAATGVIHYDLDNTTQHPVHALHGMVSSASGLATDIGVDVLRRGGNAVDAAVAVGFALSVALPNSGNIGGGGFMILHDGRTGKDTAIDFRETAPAAATRDMYLDASGNVIVNKSLFTQAAIGVPGTVAGLDYALAHYGTMKRATLIAPAVALANRGFPVGEKLAGVFAAERDHLGAWEGSRKVFFHAGRVPRAGDILRNPDLARSLALIGRDGAKAFYEGPIAAAIVAEAKTHGGLITAADLKNYKVVERMPVRGTYRGCEIVSMPPPSSGGVHIIQILNILSNFPLREWGQNSAKTIHVMAEAERRAYADRSEYVGDPDFVEVPVKGLTSPGYGKELAGQIDLAHATPSSRIKPGRPQPYESDQTTQFTVADGQGSVVSVTYTLNTNFGSGIVASGTGILLNNEMDDFSARPGVANAYGLVGGDANAVGPMKRPLSSMSPTLVLKDGKPWIATGSPGGARIITTTLQVLVDMIDFGMNPAEATSAVRFHDQWLPDELRIERGLNADTIALLRAMGHNVVERQAMGDTETIEITPTGFYGDADQRDTNGAARGY
jgi:gamma-glutamyltranspeptidase/glutathione hydrolase